MTSRDTLGSTAAELGLEPRLDAWRLAWRDRWSALATSAGLPPRAPLLLALSGGADSVLLLHFLCASSDRPAVTAVHVDHGLRGEESDEDARFCVELCRSLDVPILVRRVALDPEGPSLEARAREARYGVLLAEARRTKCRTVLTGHHADDALETVLMRWIRGTNLSGLSALRPRLELRSENGVSILRPLYGMRREEVRRLLADQGLRWREDRSNEDARFTRNRVRHLLLPELERVGGPGTLDNLRAFGRAVEDLERHLAGATAHLAWAPPSSAPASRSSSQAHLGGTLERAPLERLPSALRRRALWRLLLEGTGHGPRKRVLELVLDALAAGRCGRFALQGGWGLHLRSSLLVLQPPPELLRSAGSTSTQQWLPFPDDELARTQTTRDRASRASRARGSRTSAAAATPPAELALALAVPGEVRLADGRRVSAEIVRRSSSDPLPRGLCAVELSLEQLGELALAPRRSLALTVRFPRAGDRFHPLGAPGHRPLRRFLADAGVPRDERARVPLVCRGDEILWVAGLRPSESCRVPDGARVRLRLVLHGAAPERELATRAVRGPADAPHRAELAHGDARAQLGFWEDPPLARGASAGSVRPPALR